MSHEEPGDDQHHDDRGQAADPVKAADDLLHVLQQFGLRLGMPCGDLGVMSDCLQQMGSIFGRHARESTGGDLSRGAGGLRSHLVTEHRLVRARAVRRDWPIGVDRLHLLLVELLVGLLLPLLVLHEHLVRPHALLLACFVGAGLDGAAGQCCKGDHKG